MKMTDTSYCEIPFPNKMNLKCSIVFYRTENCNIITRFVHKTHYPSLKKVGYCDGRNCFELSMEIFETSKQRNLRVWQITRCKEIVKFGFASPFPFPSLPFPSQLPGAKKSLVPKFGTQHTHATNGDMSTVGWSRRECFPPPP